MKAFEDGVIGVRMRQWIAGLVWVSFSFQPLLAETPTPQAQNHGPQGAAQTGDRATAPNNFNTTEPHNELKALTSTFNFPETFVVRRWGVSGPQALDKIKSTDMNQRDESEVSKLMAQLFGTRDNDQVHEMIPKVESMKNAASTSGKGDEANNRYLEETKRLFWAAKYIDGEPIKSEEADKFYAFFKNDLAEVLKQNADFKQKIEDNIASGGNKDTVKEEVRNMVNHESLKAFLDSMAGSKDAKSRKFGAELADTVSFKDANGNKFIDFNGPNGEKQRFHIGKTAPEIEKSLASSVGKLASSTFSPAFHNAPDKDNEWFSPNGVWQKGQPQGFVPPAQLNPQTGQQVADQRGPQGGQQGQKIAQGGGGKPTLQAVQSLFDTNCRSCHGRAATQVELIPTETGFNVMGGGSATFAQAAGKIRVTPRMSSREGMNGALATLDAWANAK